MRVIDSSILVKYFSREEGWQEARRYIVEGFITIDLALKEVLSALVKKVRRGEMDVSIAEKLAKSIVEGRLPIVPQDDLLQDAFNIALEHGISIYDALFIALAKRRELELVTSDERQAKIAKKMGIPVVYVP